MLQITLTNNLYSTQRRSRASPDKSGVNADPLVDAEAATPLKPGVLPLIAASRPVGPRQDGIPGHRARHRYRRIRIEFKPGHRPETRALAASASGVVVFSGR